MTKRVLFTCVVGPGHFNPMVPLARAFIAAGHTVAFATDPGFSAQVRSVGFEAFPAGLDMPEARKRFLRTMPNWRDVAPQDQILHLVPGLFAGSRMEPMLDDLARIIPDWRPDLLIHDSAEMAGAIAAEVAGIAHAEHSFGVLRPEHVRRLAMDAIAAVADRLGVANPGVGGLGGELYIDICPPGIQRPDIADLPRVVTLRPVGFDESPDATVPDWLRGHRARPLVYVTMGTEFNRKPEIFRSILAGLAADSVDVLVTVGASGDPAALEPRGENVHVERFVPQSQVLPDAAAFVCHGGSGALLGGLNAGVPMLAIPQGADQFLNAETIVEHGLGLRLLPEELDAEAVRLAVRALIEDATYRETARSHRPPIDAMPPPHEVVAILAGLATA